MKNNLKNNIAQKGGLMIEALAMLGLIAVVTPTMYKKSAERTLEVEDINTADTIRSYMGATEAYMAANYRGIIKEMTENADGTPKENPDTIKEVTWNDIQSYMPYGFKNDKALYDYNSPKISLVRQGSNLSAFALFPAKAAGGLGQERTSRIASLIGANGGYTKADKSAHGIGGVWNLDAGEVSNVFGSNNNNEFSLVTASSNVVNSTSGAGQVENTKYLQRTKENDGELWRNAMRTDLYMGGGDVDSDPELTGENSGNTGNYSILNINSLIVGAEKDMAHLGDDATSANNGLYLNPDGDNPNAYIGGTLTAAKDQLFANENKFAFGSPTTATVENPEIRYRFEADKDGNITNYGDLDMGQGIAEEGSIGHVYLGSLNNSARKVNGADASHFMKADATADGASLSLLSPDMIEMTTDETELDGDINKVSGTHLMIEKTGFIGADNVDGKDSLNGDIEPKYTNEQTFPVIVGSNTLVKGVLAAGQVDAQHLRTATFSTGSENIDDTYKWMKVNKDGVVIQDIATTTGSDTPTLSDSTYINIDNEGVLMRTGSTDDAASITLKKRTEGEDTYGDISLTANNKESAITTKNNIIATQIKNRDLKIGNPLDDSEVLTYDDTVDIDDNPYRVVIGQGGNVDMVGSNLKIMDNDEYNILTVKGNTDNERTAKFGNDSTVYNDYNSYTSATAPNYNISAHGNVLFSSISENKSSEITDSSVNDDTIHYMAVGPNDEKAGVNIAESKVENAGINDNEQRVVFVDLSASNRENNTYVDGSGSTSALKLINDKIADGGENDIVDTYEKNDSGTMKAGMVYVRKGLVDIVPDKGDVATATDGIISDRTDHSANDGSGIIRASRLVANNINTSGKEERVPEMLNDALMKQFNGDNVVRYDTYMVNPAYTSVMKDIKLTTRGGARLSDVLPDFVTKGVYLANNTYDDALSRMQFILQNGRFEIDASAMGVPSSHIDNTTNGLAESAVYTGSSGKGKYSTNNWASPFSGLVPAPQCPPGYGRVITVNPFRYEMAQAGKLALSADSGYSDGVGNASGYYVNTLEMGSKLKRASYSHSNKEELQNELEAAMPKPRKVKIHGNIKVTANGGLQADGKPVTGTDTLNIADESTAEMYSNITQYTTNTTTGNQGNIGAGDFGSTDEMAQSPYILTVGEVINPSTHAKTAGLSPLVFQQSTWFHTEAIPVVNNGDEPTVSGKKGTYAGFSPDKYIRGWAVLQGFLYHQSEYSNFACAIDSEQCKQYVPKGAGENYEIIWNLFPVAKNSLGSYVTTYCYFDRLSLTDYAHPYWKSGTNDFEKYDVLNEVPISYEKGKTTSDGSGTYESDRKKYYEQLNDPTMKYNEVW